MKTTGWWPVKSPGNTHPRKLLGCTQPVHQFTSGTHISGHQAQQTSAGTRLNKHQRAPGLRVQQHGKDGLCVKYLAAGSAVVVHHATEVDSCATHLPHTPPQCALSCFFSCGALLSDMDPCQLTAHGPTSSLHISTLPARSRHSPTFSKYNGLATLIRIDETTNLEGSGRRSVGMSRTNQSPL